MINQLKQLLNTIRFHSGFKRYLANTSWIFAEQILRMIAALFVGIWVARYLGPEQYGIFSYALAFVSIFAGIAKLGLDGVVVRDLVNQPAKTKLYLGTAFWLKVMGALIVFIILAIATWFTNNDNKTNLYVFIIGIGIIFQSFEVIDFYYQSQVLSKFVSICKLTQLAISSILKIYFVLIHADLFWFILITLIDQISLSASLFIAYWHQRRPPFYRHFSLPIAKKLLSDSWPLILSGMAVAIYMRIDQVMIKSMLGSKEVGLYTAAVRLSEMWYFVPVIITASLTPAILNAKKINESLYINRLQKHCRTLTWIAIVLAIFTTFFSQSIINMTYGDEYQKAGSILAIQIWGGVFVFLGVATSVYYTAENFTKKTLYRSVLGAISNILLNLIMIPLYGIYGAAIATVISQLIANLVYDLFDPEVKDILLIKLKSLLPIVY